MSPVTCMISKTPEKTKKNGRPEDDGRPVANMNVEGMPWYSRSFTAVRKRTGDRKASDHTIVDPPITPRETRNLMIQSVVAALVIGLIFLAAIFLFILFSLHVWLR